MAILILAEHDNVNLSEQTAKTLLAAQKIGGDIDILIAGHNVGNVAAAAAKLAGVRAVLVGDAPHLEHQLAESVADLMLSRSNFYDYLLSPATSRGKNILPRVAALLDVMQISDIIEVVDNSTFKRPIYAGNAIETVKSSEEKKVITVRTTAFSGAVEENGNARIEAVGVPEDRGLSQFIKADVTANERPELTSAKVIVSGGRAFGSEENFMQLLLPLADKLGAAVGASRAAVDAGYAPNDWQVGQTGKVVAPALYVAIGISGAIQHLAGMKDSGVIVAINKDEEAPIMQIADYALVGDLFDIVPKLKDLL